MIMEPIAKSEDRGGPEFYAGQAAGPKLVPVVIVCECANRKLRTSHKDKTLL